MDIARVINDIGCKIVACQICDEIRLEIMTTCKFKIFSNCFQNPKMHQSGVMTVLQRSSV